MDMKISLPYFLCRLSGLTMPTVLLKCVYRRASALEQLGWEKDALAMFAFSVALAKRTGQGRISI